MEEVAEVSIHFEFISDYLNSDIVAFLAKQYEAAEAIGIDFSAH